MLGKIYVLKKQLVIELYVITVRECCGVIREEPFRFIS